MSESMNTVYITNINIVLKSTPQKVSILIIFNKNYQLSFRLLVVYKLIQKNIGTFDIPHDDHPNFIGFYLEDAFNGPF